jgi:hypothetical protein
MRLNAGLAFILLLISCSGKQEVPGDIIQMKPMRQIVWDMLQADELSFQRKISDSTLDLKTASFHLYDTVFAIHSISREQFYKSYEFYQRNPALYKSLMTGVRNMGDAARKAQQSPAP